MSLCKVLKKGNNLDKSQTGINPTGLHISCFWSKIHMLTVYQKSKLCCGDLNSYISILNLFIFLKTTY